MKLEEASEQNDIDKQLAHQMVVQDNLLDLYTRRMQCNTSLSLPVQPFEILASLWNLYET